MASGVACRGVSPENTTCVGTACSRSDPPSVSESSRGACGRLLLRGDDVGDESSSPCDDTALPERDELSGCVTPRLGTALDAVRPPVTESFSEVRVELGMEKDVWNVSHVGTAGSEKHRRNGGGTTALLLDEIDDGFACSSGRKADTELWLECGDCRPPPGGGVPSSPARWGRDDERSEWTEERHE